MKKYLLKISLFLLGVFTFSCQHAQQTKIDDIADLAPNWRGEIVAQVDQSYAGWDVEIGDADNDGENEILSTGCPHSRLYLFEKVNSHWKSRLLAYDLAQDFPGMGLAVKVVDLNGDGENEVILGTGQETGGTAWFYVFQVDEKKATKKLSLQPQCNKSSFTHNLAPYDLDGDTIMEVLSAYCGGGEIIRYDFDEKLTQVRGRKIYQLSGSGEESLIADVDNDGAVEFVTANGFRKGKASVEIFEFDERGELLTPPRLVINGYDGKRCFYASLMVGDVDNDGNNELVVGWKREQEINEATLMGYRINDRAEAIYTFAYEDEDLDMAYFEKMMVIADADNDGLNELLISTRGDNMSEYITSKHLGYVFMFKVGSGAEIQRTLLIDFKADQAESSWLAVGDADNDGENEIVLATGKGDRTKAGTSYIVLLEKEEGR